MQCFLWKLGLMLSLIITVAAQTPAAFVEVSGTVYDESGKLIPGAAITLRQQNGEAIQKTTTSALGFFRFARVSTGSWELEAQKEAFKSAVIPLRIETPSITPLKIVLAIADLRDEITVDNSITQVNSNSAENLDVIKLDREALNNLPTLGNDAIGALANLVDASSTGTGGATIIVDGLEMTKKTPASRIQEVRINQNPYSAEFSRPGRGRIEVITKAGSPEYHGEFGIIFRDAHLNARNAFALTRPPEQRRIYESNLTGPIGDGKKSSFFFSLNREEDNLQSVVFAQTLNGVVSQNVATPQHRTDFSFRINRQLNEKTTFSIRLEILQISNRNVGVGGFTLAEAGANSSAGEQPIISTLRQIFTPRLVNELNFLIGHENSRSRSVNPGVPKLIVQDAFTGGGAQVDGRITENHIQLTDVLSWTHGKHFVISGVNIPDISRRGFSDQANFNGAFSFATLDDYLNKRPFLFSINQGDGHLAFWQKEFALFLQDQVSLRSNFSFALGLRYEKQNYLSDKNNFAPRLSFAYSPGKQRKTVLRGGGGIFYDRTGINPIAETLRLNGVRLRQINITNPAYPNPLSAGINFANQPVSITRFAPEMRSPYTFQFNLGVERQLTKALTLSANYINTRGIKLFRSRDINAPLSGALLRPVATIGVLREIESAGRAQSHAMELILRGKINRYFNGTVQYTLGRTYNDTGGINTRPVNNYDLNGEWSRADFDERHRFNLLGAFKAGKWINLGATVALVSGRPYSLSTGRDDNHDTIANDRPIGVRRNSLEGPGAATVDVRWSKDFPLKAKNGKKAEESPSFKIALSAFNVFNRVNFTGYVNNQSSPFFGLPIASRPARRVQLNFNFNF